MHAVKRLRALQCNIITYVLAPSPYDCNFDAGTCRWTNDTTADFKWHLQNHGTPSSFTGPDHDHTTGDGKSGLIEACI